MKAIAPQSMIFGFLFGKSLSRIFSCLEKLRIGRSVVAKRANACIFQSTNGFWRRELLASGAEAIYCSQARILISPHHGNIFNWWNGIQTYQLMPNDPLLRIAIVTLAPVPRFSGLCPLPKANNRSRLIVCLLLGEWSSRLSVSQRARQKASSVMY